MHILTFDIEEWFHLLDVDGINSESKWLNYESRIHQNVDRILNLLQELNINATFFIVGWIAEKHPDVIRRIDELGYEIGSHSHNHQLVYQQNQYEFSQDLRRSLDVIQNIIGKKISSYRAPGFSITEDTKWALDALNENGIIYDCSIFPAQRAHGGVPSYIGVGPSILRHNGITIREFPINFTNVFKNKIIFSGGGYFRLLPYSLIRLWTKKSDYVMSYFHPRDFDKEQPIIKELSPFRKFKSYVGLSGCMNKLHHWLNDFHFTDLRTAASEFDWDTANVIDL